MADNNYNQPHDPNTPIYFKALFNDVTLIANIDVTRGEVDALAHLLAAFTDDDDGHVDRKQIETLWSLWERIENKKRATNGS